MAGGQRRVTMTVMAVEVPRSRLIVKILWLAGVFCVLGTVALVLWIKLPQWEPIGVVLHSPFVDPVLRAATVEAPHLYPKYALPDQYPLATRMAAWGPSVLPSLMQGLDAEAPAYRSAALCAIGAVLDQHPSTTIAMERICRLATDDSDPGVRVWAFRALRTRRAPELHAFRRLGMADTEPEVRTVVLYGLEPVTDGRDLELLLLGLRDGDSAVRLIAAIRSLKLCERRAIPALIPLVTDDPEPQVRTMALEALRIMNATETLPALREVTLRPGDAFSSRTLAVAYEIASQDGAGLLIEALGCHQMHARLYAADKLGSLKESRAIPALLAMVAGQDAMPAGMAIIALGRIGDRVAIEPVLARLADLSEFKVLNQREHERNHIPMTVRLDLEFNFERMVEVVDQLPMSPDQRKRWEALRQR